MKLAVFKTGTHTDMNGNSREWTESDLDTIISRYNPDTHEAPAVIGHPKDNAPAWGWVTGLSKDSTGTLYAEFGQMDQDFMDMLAAGRFKKRSISLYPDLTLKHVGFLGAAPPAIKGLPDYKFASTEEQTIIEYQENAKEKKIMEFTWNDLKEFIGLTRTITPEPVKIEEKKTDVVSFSEADLEAAKKQAADDAAAAERTRLTLEFAEKEKVAAQNARGEAIKNELTQLVTSGKVLPAWMKLGLAEFMCALDAGTEIQFSEEKKQNPLDWFRGFLAELPKAVDFSEHAATKHAASGDAIGKLETLIQKKMDEKKGLSYSAAFAEVQTENPDLVAEYIQ